MNRHALRFIRAAAVASLAAACKGDPVGALPDEPNRITTSLSYVTVDVGDSVLITATARDTAGNPIPVTVDVASEAEGVVAVSDADPVPLPQVNFFIKGVSYGTGTVALSSGGASTTITVQTFPAGVAIAGAVDTIGSGTNLTLTAAPFDAVGGAVTVAETFIWSSSNTAVAVVDSLTGVVTGKSPGSTIITVIGPGSPDPVEGEVTINVKPGVFGGTLSATSGVSGDVVTITKAATDPDYDADVQVTFDDLVTFITNRTATTLTVVVPGTGIAGAIPFVVANVGPDQLASGGTFTGNTADLDDAYTPANEDPSTGPVINANGDYYVIVHGGCTDGVADGPTANCDDFFTITNSTGAGFNVAINLAWFTAADVDLLWCNAGCTALVGNTAGATGANPENSTVTIPAGTTYRVWINLWAPGAVSDLVRVRVTGLP